MRVSADHAFHIGSQHLRSGMPCQDYATSDTICESGYAVISDGCSSGGQTDVGARVIGLSIAKGFSNCGQHFDRVNHELNERIMPIETGLGLDQNDMLATCLYAFADVTDGKQWFSSRVFGDGVEARVTTSGTIIMTRYEWAKNMPVYPVYERDGFAGFISAHGGAEAIACTRMVHVRASADDASGEDLEPKQLTVREAMFGHRYLTNMPIHSHMAVFSDGVTQVDGMDWRDVVAELLRFKSTEGEFVKRRMNRFLKDCLKHGKGPVDDIAMACIHIDHDRAP